MPVNGQQPHAADSSDQFDVDRFEIASSERAPAALRTILAAHFHTNRRTWDIVPLSRQRILFASGDSTVCDICIVAADAPVERVVRTPPMVCIDVISSEPLAFVQNRVDAYESMGVKHIWLLDPAFRTGWRATSSGLFQVRDDQLAISGTSVGFRLATLFNEMDEMIRPGRRNSVQAALSRTRSETKL